MRAVLVVTSLLALANAGKILKTSPDQDEIIASVKRSFELQKHLFQPVRNIPEFQRVYAQVIDKCQKESDEWLKRSDTQLTRQSGNVEIVNIELPMEFFGGCTVRKIFIEKVFGEVPEGEEEHRQSLKEYKECVIKQNELAKGDYAVLGKNLMESKACVQNTAEL